jgi:protein tyrosine/serine phosphatase
MPGPVRCLLIAGIVVVVGVAPVVHYRMVYTHAKRLREVTPGRVYRSGQMTAEGFVDAVRRYHIRTIINLQDEYPDPNIDLGYFEGGTIKESELCRQLGVTYRYLPPDLIPRRLIPEHRPAAIETFLRWMDQEETYPVLLHCRAGVHRTGVMAAVYRMEYENWTPRQAVDELKEVGFGEWQCTSANDYITQYILTYRRGVRDE